ncbi:MAG: Wzz/FepE/Etk N-terminal domain-containing protein [Chitinophagaceae bacterium]
MSQGLQHDNSEQEYQGGKVWLHLFDKFKGLKYQGRQILLSGLVFGLLGLGYSFLKKPVYLARVNFVIEENKQNAGGLFSALAGQIGVDLSSLSGISGILAGDNVLELLKSTTMLKKVLLTPYPGDTTLTLAYKYAESYGKLAQYNKLVGGDFRKPANTRAGDSILNVIAIRIIEKELAVYKPDRKLSVFRLDLTTRDELLSQTIGMRMINKAADQYIQTKTKRLRNNVERLQTKADSIADLLNVRTVRAAEKDIINQNPSYINTEVDIEISSREKSMLNLIYADLNKSIDLTRTALIQETPTIEIIDTPDLPLKKEEVKWYFAIALGIVLGIGAYIIFFVWFSNTKKNS